MSETMTGSECAAEASAPQAGRLSGGARSAVRLLFRPIDIASLVVFRIAFGVIMAWEALRYLVPRVPAGTCWARQYYIDPPILFTYHGFAWVGPWPGDGMIYHFWAWAIAAVCVTVGLCYRAAAVVLFLLATHVFLLDQTRYLNHMYLICLLCFLIVFLPLHRACSIDAKLRPRIQSDVAPAWTLQLLRFQIGVVYAFSGIARANGDWLRGEPMRGWLRERGAGTVFEPILTSEWAPYFFSWGGMLFDLLIVPLLLWRRTRAIAFCVAVGFHLCNAYLFHIGVFPWLGIAATTLFLEPGWVRGLLRRVQGNPAAEAALPAEVGERFPVRGAVVAGVVVYATVQLVVPLRHWLYPGSVHWTKEGHNFAWRMRLDDRQVRARVEVVNLVTGERRGVDLNGFLSERQQQVMFTRPDMLVQFAHHLAEHYAGELGSGGRPRVYADVRMSLNGRPMKQFIDPTVDLASRRVSMRPADWIVRQDLEPLR